MPSLRSPTPWAPDFSRKSTSGPCSENSAFAPSALSPKLHSQSPTKATSAGEYFADLLVEDVLVVELKCVDRFSSEHTAQCLNYLRVSGRTVCLVVNFQKPKFEWKRIVQGFGVGEPLETPAVAG